MSAMRPLDAEPTTASPGSAPALRSAPRRIDDRVVDDRGRAVCASARPRSSRASRAFRGSCRP